MLSLHDICLKPYNTFGIKVRAKQLIKISSPAVLSELKDAGKLENQTILVLGEGSNILFINHFDGIVLNNMFLGKEIVKETNEHIFLKINGGENWSTIVDYSVSKNWGGIENLSLIPGTVGAAPVQNIGAYGVELQDIFVQLSAFDFHTGKFNVFSKEECDFAYRSSVFKTKFPGRYFITDVTLKMSKNPALNLEYGPLKSEFEHRSTDSISVNEVSEVVKKIRRSKLPDPAIIGNAGSFFKNPVISENKLAELKTEYPQIPNYIVSSGQFKLAAGWLIEKCGWKGKRFGDAGVHEKQALVLVNYGNASGKEILALSELIVKSVAQKFGVELEKEVRIV